MLRHPALSSFSLLSGTFSFTSWTIGRFHPKKGVNESPREEYLFKFIARPVIMWTTGFGRYLDLVAGVALLFIAWSWSQPLTAALGALALLSFTIDINGIFQRWTLNRLLAKKGMR